MTGLSASELMWKPDAYCENARESNLGEASDSINSLVFIHPDGLVLYSRLYVLEEPLFTADEQLILKNGSFLGSVVL